MNLRNISANQIVVWSALVLGLVLAVIIGNAVGSSDMRIVAGVIAAIPVVVIFVKLKIFTLFFATRALPWKRKLGTLDYLIYINLAYLATVYVRNPAGFWALQTSMVGGRPYFEVGLALGAYAILSRVQISDFIAKVFPMFFVIPAWCVALLDLAARLLPQTATPIAMLYSGVSAGGASGAIQQETRVGETRLIGMQWAGWSSVLALCARYNPITLLSPFYLFRALLFTLAIGAIFLSGFRSVILFAIVAFLLSTILRGNMKDLVTAGAGMLLGLILLISVQGSFVQLPLTVQRTLSWLPGDWDQKAVADAEGSTQWRVEMWGWAWNDDRILRDKIWGQGFGLSLDDLSLIAASLMAGQSGQTLLGGSDRESFLITGTFHSGPLSAIKYIGIVGLALYYLLMCYMALAAWRLCINARGTKAFTLALFVGIPIIFEPFNFVVIFGALDQNYPQILFWAGLLKMTQRYLDTVKSTTRSHQQLTYRNSAEPVRELHPVFSRQPVVQRPL
jgi:hypothetical protein